MTSAYLLRPTRSRQEYLEELMREERATPAEYREWLHMDKEPFREARKPRPLLRGSAAVGAGYVLGLEAFHKAMLAKQR